jgi:plasmid stabilization system protein ParE
MLKWTPKSEDDLDQIREHIAKNFSVDMAIESVNDLVDYVERTLGLNPLAGNVFESNPLFSKLVYRGNSIFYCENPKDKHLYVVYVRPRGTDLQNNRVGDEEVA